MEDRSSFGPNLLVDVEATWYADASEKVGPARISSEMRCDAYIFIDDIANLLG